MVSTRPSNGLAIVNCAIGVATQAANMSRDPVAEDLHGQEYGIKLGAHIGGVHRLPADASKQFWGTLVPVQKDRAGHTGRSWVSSAGTVTGDQDAIPWLEMLMSELVVVAHVQSQVGHSICLNIVVAGAVVHTQRPIVPKAEPRVCPNAMQEPLGPPHHWFVRTGGFPEAIDLVRNLQVINTEQESNMAQVNAWARVLQSRRNVCQGSPFPRRAAGPGKQITPALGRKAEFLGSPDRSV
jgi:hypothetical protein